MVIKCKRCIQHLPHTDCSPLNGCMRAEGALGVIFSLLTEHENPYYLPPEAPCGTPISALTGRFRPKPYLGRGPAD